MLGIFLDTETNGLDPSINKIIEIAFKIINLQNGDELFTYETVVFQPKDVWDKSNKESLKINGFKYEKVSLGKTENTVKEEIINIFKKFDIIRKKSVFICQNPSFDRIFFSQIINQKIQEELLWPYHWLDLASMYWAVQLFQKKDISSFSSFSKDAIAKNLGLPAEKKPHLAINGVMHLIMCYEKLLGFPQKK